MYCVAGAIGPRAYEELYTACNLVPCEDTHAALLAADAPLADLFADWERAADRIISALQLNSLFSVPRRRRRRRRGGGGGGGGGGAEAAAPVCTQNASRT